MKGDVMGTEIGVILAAAWSIIGIPLVARGFKWLGSKINQNKIAERSQIDEQIVKALEIAVANVGNKTADAVKADKKVWTAGMKDTLRDAAKEQAEALLDDTGRKVFRELGDTGIDILIRKLVDERAGKE